MGTHGRRFSRREGSEEKEDQGRRGSSRVEVPQWSLAKGWLPREGGTGELAQGTLPRAGGSQE